jgi:hypothetical protein
VQDCTRREFPRQKTNELRLDQATLVMPFLGPGIGKPDANRGEAAIQHPVLQPLHGVRTDHPYISNSTRIQQAKQVPYPWLVHLDPDKVGLGISGCRLRQRFAVSKTDLDDKRGRTPEQFDEINRALPRLHAKSWPQRVKCPALGRCQSTLAQNVAAYGPAAANVTITLTHCQPPIGSTPTPNARFG